MMLHCNLCCLSLVVKKKFTGISQYFVLVQRISVLKLFKLHVKLQSVLDVIHTAMKEFGSIWCATFLISHNYSVTFQNILL